MSWLSMPLLGRRDRAPFALIVAITACGTLGMHLIIPALPDTARDLHVSPGAIQLTITLYLIGLAIGQLIYGPISDRFGRRPVLLGGLALFTFAGIATAAAPGALTLVVARVLQSIGACAGLVLGRAIVRDSAAADRAAAQLAMLTMVMSMAPAIAPVLGGYATAWIGWRAAFALLAIVGSVTLLLAVLLLPETNRAQTGTRASMLVGSLRLFRSRAFCGYILGGACTTTSFYAFMAASPFILVDLLHQPTERVGLYYLLLMAGVAVGSFTANRIAGRVRVQVALRLANSLAIAGAALFLAADLTGMLSVTTVIAPVVLFMVGAGMASPFALSGAVSVNPHAIGAASGLYGFTQMAYGALCTVIVEVWHPGSVLTVAVVLLGSALLGQAALSLAVQTTRHI
ncbi:MAG TPA: multidrug effflux MFS transporter [Acetobacteraceae bacterium]|jgi:MFS transporter, DHA1 family, multidrug resistance protein|nr:multidrug effflux MFS transporter [Acetobacteraceae bacterium]